MSGGVDAPLAYGTPPVSGRVRTRPEDFRVTEILGFTPDGEGQHVLLRVRKTGTNTHYLAERLAAAARIPARTVAYAGRKDRHAVTEQWFSIDLAGRPEPDWHALALPGTEVLEAVRHRRKLRRGALRGNRFVLLLRQLRGDLRACERRLMEIERGGVPNYFGPQRFGRRGDNAARAAEVFRGCTHPRSRNERSMLLSAARSAIFNAVLAARVARGDWSQAHPGDVLQLNGARSWFVLDSQEDPVAAARRCRAGDLHPTGPLWGRGEPPSLLGIRALEERVAGAHAILARGLEEAGLEQARRSLRLPVADLRWEPAGDRALLSFFLPAGGYATSVLRELTDGVHGGGEHAAPGPGDRQQGCQRHLSNR